MSESSSSSLSSSVYVHPKQFIFYADDKHTYTQSATLFNPFEFLIKFKVLSTAPAKYSVTDPTGFIKPKQSVDIPIKHHGFQSGENLSDKLRIQIYNSSGGLIGKRDLMLHSVSVRDLFHQRKSPSQTTTDDHYLSMHRGNGLMTNSVTSMSNNFSSSTSQNGQLNKKKQRIPSGGPNQQNNLYNQTDSVSYLVIFVGLMCLVVMFLPIGTPATPDQLTTFWAKVANFFYISFEIKLFAAFVLGMITMVILKV